MNAKTDKFYRGDVVGDMISLAVNTETPSLDVIASRYRKRKKELNVMDFDELLFNWREFLLNFSDFHEAYAGRFLQVLVDE